MQPVWQRKKPDKARLLSMVQKPVLMPCKGRLLPKANQANAGDLTKW
jgi:hypothetical protein